MPLSQRTRSSPVTRIQPVLLSAESPAFCSRASSCVAGLVVDVTAISDCAGADIAGYTKNSRTLDYSGGLRGLCRSDGFTDETEDGCGGLLDLLLWQ